MTYDEHALLTTQWRHSVGAGWWDVVEETHQKLLALDSGYQIDQIKQKFGGLRYYFSPSQFDDGLVDEAMNKVVAEAEKKCSKLCEACGKPGRIRGADSGYSWWQTVCDECAEETRKRMTAYNKEWEEE